MNRIEREKRIVEKMIGIYCRHKEGNESICQSCSELVAYAHQRLSHCVYGEEKPTCRRCPIHCYRQDMAERMREVMRYSGPRMMIYAPLTAIGHFLREIRHTAKK